VLSNSLIGHRAFPQPSDSNAVIWRYLDDYKFIWLLEERRLWMSSTDQLKDSLEATTPRGDLVAWSKLAADELDEEKGKIISDNRTKLSAYAAHFKPSYYVSCWHLNDHENWRMWERYTKGPNAVAIRTTLPLFRRSLSPSIGIGIVGYIDYSTEHLPTSLNMFEYIMHKNITFSFEQELRAVACELMPFGDVEQTQQNHFFVSENNPDLRICAPPISVLELVQAVVLHPAATIDFSEAVAKLCNQSGLGAPTPSSLAR
jgi:hypothetical protein